MNDSFSTLQVAPHPATYVPVPLAKKKYVPPSKRDPNDPTPPTMDDRNFPLLNVKPKVTCAPIALNYLSKIKEAEAKREEETMYDRTKFATMTPARLEKEGWSIVTKDDVKDTKPTIQIEEPYIPLSSNKVSRPWHPDSPRLVKRKVLSSRPSYTDLYEMEFDEDGAGAIVPTLDEEEDGQSSV